MFRKKENHEKQQLEKLTTDLNALLQKHNILKSEYEALKELFETVSEQNELLKEMIAELRDKCLNILEEPGQKNGKE